MKQKQTALKRVLLVVVLVLLLSISSLAGAATLDAPANFTLVAANAENTAVTLSWDAVAGADHYYVMRSDRAGSAAMVQGGQLYTTSYTDSGLALNHTYYYYVVAVEGTINFGQHSPTLSFKTPNQPLNLVLQQQSANSFRLDWDAITDATRYSVYRSTDGTDYTLISSQRDTWLPDDNLALDTTYWYKVVSSNGSEEIVSGQTDAQMFIGAQAQALSPSQIKVEWEAVAGATSYTIARSIYDGGYTNITTVTELEYLDDGLTAGDTYWYQITADNGPTVTCSATTPLLPILTATATAVNATSVQLSWEAVSGATSYTISRSLYYGSNYSQVAVTANTNFLNTSVSNLTTYWYKIEADNGVIGYCSVFTPDHIFTVDAEVQGYRQIDLDWDRLTTGINTVFRAVDEAGPYTRLGSTANGSSWEDTTCKPGTTYWYRVTDGSYTAYVSATTPMLYLTVDNATSSMLDIAWDGLFVGASSYTLYRGLAEGIYDATPIYSGTDLAYTDTGLKSSTKYYYKVVTDNDEYAIGSGTTKSSGGSNPGGSDPDPDPEDPILIDPEEVPLGPPLEFDRFNHYAYLTGYPGATFQPEANMTRAELAVMLFRLSRVDDIDLTNLTINYTDVADGNWYVLAVAVMDRYNVINGYPDGTFRPHQSVTRAEFAAMISRYEKELDGGELTDSFADLAVTHWGNKFVSYCEQRGWIEGYPDGSFRPDALIKRIEVAAATNRILQRSADLDQAEQLEIINYSDVASSYWGYADVVEATNSHDYKWVEQAYAEEYWVELIAETFVHPYTVGDGISLGDLR